MHRQFLPQDKQGKLDHILEECGEVITAYAKIIRFGPDSCDPTVPEEERVTNMDALLEELKDLESALVRYRLHGFTLRAEEIF